MTTANSARPLAVVTGASSGIGYELAKVFAEHGYDLIIVSDSERIQEAARTLGGSAEVVPFQADLSTPGGVESLVALIRDSGRPVDSVVINAGIGVWGDFARETSLDDELRLVNLNVTGSVHLAKRMTWDMVRAGAGRILFTSSIAATMPAPLESVYGASKAFLLSFAEALRNELKDAGITVTALMPGPTETNFFHRAGMDDTKVGQKEKDDAARVARQGFDALMSGDDKVVAGSLKNKVEAVVARVLPDSVKAKQHRKLVEREEDDSDHQG
jgi:short-subunit dehydrogenase